MVYEENGGYTELSHEFSNEMYEAIKPIIDKFQEKGMSVEAIAYVSYNEVERIKSDIVKLVAVEKMMNNIIATNECYSLKQLHINGNDLIGLGFHGKEVGEVLNILLEKVIDNKEYNHKLALIVLANRIYRERQK